jgi:hypothetical protein
VAAYDSFSIHSTTEQKLICTEESYPLRLYVILRIAIANQKRDLAVRYATTPQRGGYEEAPLLGQKTKPQDAERAGGENACRDTSYFSGSPTSYDWVIRKL